MFKIPFIFSHSVSICVSNSYIEKKREVAFCLNFYISSADIAIKVLAVVL